MGIFSFICLALGILLAGITANEFGKIAMEKGYDGTKYFLWCFLFFPIGSLMVIALPDRGEKSNNFKKSFSYDDLPEL